MIDNGYFLGIMVHMICIEAVHLLMVISKFMIILGTRQIAV